MHSITLQVRFEWPHDLLMYFQERGRGSWSQGVRSTCIVFGDFTSFIYLASQLLMASKQDNSEQYNSESSCSNEVERFNSAISPWKHITMQQSVGRSGARISKIPTERRIGRTTHNGSRICKILTDRPTDRWIGRTTYS
jgi:hypothetical protein